MFSKISVIFIFSLGLLSNSYAYDYWPSQLKSIVMTVQDGKESPLPSRVPFYYSFSKEISKGKMDVPILKKHVGNSPVFFKSNTVSSDKIYLGAYVPSGYSARYRARFFGINDPACSTGQAVFKENWRDFDFFNRDRGNISPSVLLDNIFSELNEYSSESCLLIQWRVDKIHDYPGNVNQIFEQPTAQKNGIDFLPVSMILEAQAPGKDGGGIYFDISEDFGGIPKEFKIKTGNRDYISLLHNIGAPTDDGLNWGISMVNAVGLYGKADAPTDLGSSQFCGHADSGSEFGSVMWGMKTPLEKIGSSVFSARLCEGKSCFVPMYSDWTSAAKNYGGTFPFLLPRSVQPWDGQINKIANETVLDKNGFALPIQRLTYSFNYRVHKDFQAEAVLPHLWFNQALSDVKNRDARRRLNIYLVHVGGGVSKLAYNDLLNPGDGGSWDDLCRNDDNKNHCSVNPNRNFDVTCQCSYTKPEIKRVVFDYFDNDVAISLEGSGAAFNKIVFQTQYIKSGKGRPFVLISASNDFKKNYSNFKSNQEIYSDGYFFQVGTLENLTKAGFGL